MTTTSTGIAVLASRFGWLPANISPLGSWGFFGSSSRRAWVAFAAFASSIVLFDALKGGWYQGWWITYLGFAAYPTLGWIARHSWRHQVLALPAASFLFFLISNFGVWLYWYPNTLSGLLTCYLAALPFYSRTLLGDLSFGWGYMAIKSLLDHTNKTPAATNQNHELACRFTTN